MASSYTTRNRFTKQGTGENTNSWGGILNVGGGSDTADEALDGVVTLTASATLSTANGASDQARKRIINYTGASPGTITIPSVEKWYLVRAATQACTITNGSSSATVQAGEVCFVLTDGATVWKMVAGEVPAPTRNSQPATKKYVDDTAFDSMSGTFPGQAGNAGAYLSTDGTTPEWVAFTTDSIPGLQDTLDALQTDVDGKEPIDRATAANFRANDAAKLLANDVVWSAAAPVTITYASTVSLDMSTFINATITLTGGITFSAPANAKPGQTFCLEIIQDATGNRAATFNSAFKFANSLKTLSTTASAKDYVFGQVISSGLIICSLVKAPS